MSTDSGWKPIHVIENESPRVPLITPIYESLFYTPSARVATTMLHRVDVTVEITLIVGCHSNSKSPRLSCQWIITTWITGPRNLQVNKAFT